MTEENNNILILCADNNSIYYNNTLNIMNKIFDNDFNVYYIGLDILDDNNYNMYEADISKDITYLFGENYFSLIINEYCPIRSDISVYTEDFFHNIYYLLDSEGYYVEYDTNNDIMYVDEYDNTYEEIDRDELFNDFELYYKFSHKNLNFYQF
jgi:hypothetical protein